MQAPNAGNVLLGRGAIYFDRFADGTTNKDGEIHLGNCTVFELSTADEAKELFESMTDASGLYKKTNTKRTIELKITGNEFSKENLALLSMGDTSALAQGSGSVTDQAGPQNVKQGRWYPLAHRAISSVIIKVSAVTKALNTDYTLDTVGGRVYIVPGGGIADLDDLTVSYSYAADSSEVVRGGVSGNISGFLRFVGDPAAGPVLEVEVWKVSMAPDGAVGLISDDYGNWSLVAAVESDLTGHPTEPYYRIIKRA